MASGSSRAPVDITITDTLARRSVAPVTLEPLPESQVPGVSFVPLGPAATAPVFGLIAAPARTLHADAGRARGAARSTCRSRCRAATAPTSAAGSPAFPAAAQPGARCASIRGRRTPLVFEYDADGSGTIDSQTTLMSETLVPRGRSSCRRRSSVPETLPAAGPYGFNVALLFDRIVDAAAAADRNNYSMPQNELRNARRQLSGRLVFGSLAQPEHTYVPTTITVAGMPDPRGVPGAAAREPLRSLLRDPGAVVSGRILNPDGTPVVGASVSLPNNPNWKTCEMPAELPDRLRRRPDGRRPDATSSATSGRITAASRGR